MSFVNSVSTCPSSSFCEMSISSSNSTAISSSSTCYTRCEGLDLLVKAVDYVDGSIIGVPFVQKRVLIRRRRRRGAAYVFSDFVVNELFDSGGGGLETEEMRGMNRRIRIPITKEKRQRRAIAMPLKYQDSVIQPWKRRTRGIGWIQVCADGSEHI